MHTGHQFIEVGIALRFDECHPEVECELTMFGGQLVVTDKNDFSPLTQDLCDCSARNPQAPYERRASGHRIRACCVKSAMKMATAVATQIPEMIQNRMMTVVSGQPLSSKWWWIGDILNKRFLRPDALNTPI